jgi:hypothetical protein
MTKDDNDRLVNMARNAREQSSVATIKAFVDYLEYLNRYNISRVAGAQRQHHNNQQGDTYGKDETRND